MVGRAHCSVCPVAAMTMSSNNMTCARTELSHTHKRLTIQLDSLAPQICLRRDVVLLQAAHLKAQYLKKCIVSCCT